MTTKRKPIESKADKESRTQLFAAINKRHIEMLDDWRQEFDMRILAPGIVNIIAYRSDDIRPTELATRGNLKTIAKMFERFDKKVREFMRGHEVLVLRTSPEVCGGSGPDVAIFLIGWRHSKREARLIGGQSYRGKGNWR